MRYFLKIAPKNIGLSLFLLISLCTLKSFVSAECLTVNPDSLIAAIDKDWRLVKDCSCTMEAHIRKGNVEQDRISEYIFKKPKWIRMKIIEGDNAGAEVMFDPYENEVTARASGILGIFPISFSPENSRVRSIRGHRLDENYLGFVIDRWKSFLEIGEPKCSENDSLITLEFSGMDTLKNYGAFSEKLFIGKNPILILGFEQYSIDGILIHSVKLRNIKSDIGLRIEDFDL